MYTAAVIQLQSTSDESRNLEQATRLIERAARAGATFVATPENTNFLGPHEAKVSLAQPLEGPLCAQFAGLARHLGIHLLLGSFNERAPEEKRCYNTSVLFGPGGERLAHYRKIHLFDVDVSDEVRFQESRTIVPGDTPVVTATQLATFGLSICYDLRFGELYHALVLAGATVLTVPSAFTLTTGRDHWYPLLRARAIETQCFVLAPAQSGQHDDRGQRHSYGHSLIVDPWGHVLASAADGPGFALAEIDLDRVARVRRAIPVAQHRRLDRLAPSAH